MKKINILVFLSIILAIISLGFYFNVWQPLLGLKTSGTECWICGKLENRKDRQLLDAAREHVRLNSVEGLEFDLKVVKKIENWALVEVLPEDNATDDAGVILEKIEGVWTARDMGTMLPEWEEEIPELFE